MSEPADEFQEFAFRKHPPRFGAWVIDRLKEHMDADWYQDRIIRAQIAGKVVEFRYPTSIHGLRLVGPNGVSDLINPVETYTGIIIPKNHLYLFKKKPDEW